MQHLTVNGTQTTEGTGNSDHPQGLKEKNHPSSGENK